MQFEPLVFPLRRILVLLALALCWPPQSVGALEQGEAGFQDFLQAIWPLAQARGVRRETFEAAFKGLEPDPTSPSASSKQAEFDKPLKSYLAEAVTKARIQRGRAALKRFGAELARIEQRFGVPGEIIVAAWGVETDFGAAKGGKDIIRSLATLAYRRQDRGLFLDELISALIILDKGEVARTKLKGSWAGAMGDPQFIPSAYLKYAVSFDGSAFADIWDRPQDGLASIANFLRQSGWRPLLPWGVEVIIPAGFRLCLLASQFQRLRGARPCQRQWRRPSGFGRGDSLPASGRQWSGFPSVGELLGAEGL